MSKLYIVIDDHAVQPIDLCATKRDAKKSMQAHCDKGESASIVEEDVPMRGRDVVNFIIRRFGTMIFE